MRTEVLERQQGLFGDESPFLSAPPKGQLLKWIGNKQRFASQIISYFPHSFGTYIEPFLGSGAVLATLSPRKAIASDSFGPLMEIWQTLHRNPKLLKRWYSERWERMRGGDKVDVYEFIKASYNRSPNGADLVFLCRACYGGVVRFRQADGHMSTPCGVHEPISPSAFAQRVDEWSKRTKGAEFSQIDHYQAIARARKGGLVYCDPPYTHSQAILYGAQSFSLVALFELIAECKKRGVYVALSIDGSKKSGNFICNLPVPEGVFEREIFVNIGRSMLKRFQMKGHTLGGEVVSDRLLLTY